MTRKEVMLAALGALAFAVAMFPRAAAGRGAFFFYDTWMQNLTFRAWWFEQLRDGHFATWCSGMFAGYPLFAETQTGPLYPPVFLLFSVLPPTLAFTWNVLLHFAAAGLGTYLLTRRLGAGPAGAALAAVAFEGSGFLVTHVVHLNLLIGATWLPWSLWLALRATDGGDSGRRAALALAAVFGGLLLGAHPYATLMAFAATGLVVAFRAGGRPAAWGRGIGFLVVTVGLGAALAAVQVLPTREFLPQTTRGEAVAWDFLTFGSWEPWRLASLVAPDLYGTPVDGSYWSGPDWSHYAETATWVGTATLALAVVALVLAPGRAALPAVATLLGLLLMLGRYTPAYKALTLIPLFQSTRLPSRFALVFSLGLALLAGLGLDALRREADPKRRRRAALAGGAVVVALAAWAWWQSAPAVNPGELATVGRAFAVQLARITERADIMRSTLLVTTLASLAALVIIARRGRPKAKGSSPTAAPIAAGALVVGVVAIELLAAGRDFNPLLPSADIQADPPVVSRLDRDGANPRPRVFRQGVDEVWQRQPGARVDVFTPAWRGNEASYSSGAWALPPNTQLLYGVDSGEGFTSLLPLDWLDWMGVGRSPGAAPKPNLSQAQAELLALDAVISTGSGIGGEAWRPEQLRGDVWVSHHRRALPRVRRANSWRTVPREALLSLVQGDAHSPRDHVLLEATPAGLPAVRDGGATDLAVEYREVAPGHWEIILPATSSPEIVVMAERFDPDWRATGPAGDLPLFRAEGLFLAFVAPAEGGHVMLRHEPPSLRIGAFVSGGALVLLLLGFVVRRVVPPSLPSLAAPPALTGGAAAVVALVVLASIGANVGDLRRDTVYASLGATAARSWEGEAAAAWRAGAPGVAAELLRATVRYFPDANNFYRLGLAEESVGNLPAARAAWEEALRRKPEHTASRDALRNASLPSNPPSQ